MSARAELLNLARAVAAGTIRPQLADEIVPLTASAVAPNILATFAELVEAVGSHRPVEDLLNRLTAETAVA